MVDLVNIAGKRGNLGINAGDASAVNVEFMFPPPTALWKGIADGPTILPEFTLANMMNYFVTRKVCDGEIAGDFKHVNNHSYRLLYIQLDVMKCLNWLPLAGRRLSHRCTAVENAIKGDIPQHFESFKSTLRSSHGYNTRHGYLPRLPKPKTECGKRVSYFRFTNDWMSLPVFLRKPMPCTIFKKNLTRFLMDEYF